MVESSQFTVALHIPATKKVSGEAIVYFPDTNATPADVYKIFSTRMTDLKVARLEEAPLAHIMMKNAGVKGFEPKNRTWDSTDTDVFKQGQIYYISGRNFSPETSEDEAGVEPDSLGGSSKSKTRV